MSKSVAIVAGAGVAAFLGGIWFLTSQTPEEDRFAQCRGNAIAGGAASIGGPFELTDENGVAVTDKDVIKGPTLLYFGYTFCPDVCPLDNARNAEAMEILETRGQKIGSLFISVDPERDTPEHLKDFTDYMHPDLIGLTGTPEQVKAASKAYRTYYKRQPSEDEYYLIDHTTFTYLVTPDDGFVEYFKRDLTPEDMADKLGCFLENM